MCKINLHTVAIWHSNSQGKTRDISTTQALHIFYLFYTNAWKLASFLILRSRDKAPFWR